MIHYPGLLHRHELPPALWLSIPSRRSSVRKDGQVSPVAYLIVGVDCIRTALLEVLRWLQWMSRPILSFREASG